MTVVVNKYTGGYGIIKLEAKGEYRLRSTGEVVVNPDYTSAWVLTAPTPKQ